LIKENFLLFSAVLNMKYSSSASTMDPSRTIRYGTGTISSKSYQNKENLINQTISQVDGILIYF